MRHRQRFVHEILRLLCINENHGICLLFVETPKFDQYVGIKFEIWFSWVIWNLFSICGFIFWFHFSAFMLLLLEWKWDNILQGDVDRWNNAVMIVFFNSFLKMVSFSLFFLASDFVFYSWAQFEIEWDLR